MEDRSIDLFEGRQMALKVALLLALITIYYNIAEGLISVFFGFEDETIALFGFGLDSFVEVISGIGIWHMITRIKGRGDKAVNNPDAFESRALKITGTAFYILFIGLIISVVYNLYSGRKPETTFWGIVIASVSIITMWLLIHYKVKIGKKLDSNALLSDAACTRACMYLSIVLLVSSAGYELTGFGGLDSIGAITIAGFSFKEGREAFEKSKGCACSCSCNT